MAYIKHEWQTGETIFATNLNHMEDGIEAANSGGVLGITITRMDDATNWILNKTWKQINDTLVGGGIVFENLLQEQDGVSVAQMTILKDVGTGYDSFQDNPYTVTITRNENGDSMYFSASTQDDYPKTQIAIIGPT